MGKLDRYVSHILDSKSSRNASGHPWSAPSFDAVAFGISDSFKLLFAPDGDSCGSTDDCDSEAMGTVPFAL